MSIVRTSTGTLQRSDDEEYSVSGLTQITGADTYFYPQGDGVQEVSPVGGDLIAGIFGAGGRDFSDFQFRNGFIFQDEAGTTTANTIGQPIGRVNASKSAHNAQQATAGFKPLLQAEGAKYDGSDDNHLSDWIAENAVDGCIVALTNVPATIAATQYLAGAFNPTTNNRFSVGISPTGQIQCGLGTAAIVGVGASVLNSRSVVGVTIEGATRAYKIFANGVIVATGVFTYGTGPIALASRIGALSAGAGAGNHYAGAIRRCAFGSVYLSDAEITAISQQLLAS